MDTSIGFIGGADGPTAIFVTGEPAGIFWRQGLIIVVLLLIPNILYALRHRNEQNLCTSRVLNILEQVGRYGCMAFMVTSFGLFDIRIPTVGALMLYMLGNRALILAYWLCWIPWFKKKRKWNALALAWLPTCIFLLSGITMGNWILTGLAVVFGAAHTMVTLKNLPEGA